MFELAANHVSSFSSTLSEDTLLILYSFYKQATVGECNIEKPGFLDFKGKKKWEAWKSLGNMTKEVAMENYIQAVAQIDPNWSENQSSTFGIGVSCLVDNSERVADENKTVFDWVKESNIDMTSVNVTPENVNLPDENGMVLIHWACDRGNVKILELLINKGADVNITDSDGQTPLHYASSCCHSDIVKLLLDEKANPTLKDNDGLTAKDVATENEIVSLFS